ncbi:MAG: dockerin type I domain-containing protein [Planctomycetota bacterium]
MRCWSVLVVALGVGTALPCARGEVVSVYTGEHIDVRYTDVAEFTCEDERRTRVTLQVVGKGGFLPSSFDGVMRQGTIGGATGITASGLHPGANHSRFLDDPDDMLWVDPALLGGYTPDPSALTGLFALTHPSAIGPVWDLAEVVVRPAANVRLDFTIGHAGTDLTEGIDISFVAPGMPDLPGDVNGDGTVDLDDFVILKSHFGMVGNAVRCDGDLDGDGDVDLDDFVALKKNFGATATAAPEPAALALLAAGWACLPARRRR